RSELAAGKAEVERIDAEDAYAKVVFDQESMIYKQNSTTERKYLEALQKYKASQASREKSRALVRKTEQALEAMIGDEHASVAEVNAQISTAKLNLEWTKVYAPANGYVTNLQLREGSYVHVGKPVLTCIESDQWWIVANFRENSLENVRPGQPVGITLAGVPGRVFRGKVQSVGWGVNQGQGVPSGELPDVKNMQSWIRTSQRFQVRIVPANPE